MKKSYGKSRKEYEEENLLDANKILAAMKRYKESPKKPTSVAFRRENYSRAETIGREKRHPLPSPY